MEKKEGLINRTLSGLQDPAMSSRSFGIELHFDRLNTAHPFPASALTGSF